MNEFKEGDYIIRTERGLTTKDEITIGKTYKVLNFNPVFGVCIINDKGSEGSYDEQYFILDKNTIVINILNDL